jgi:uncharacterized membrane protein
MMNGYDMNGWGWFGMTMMILIVTIVGLLAWATTARRPREAQNRSASAREQLDAQLATGKIDTREYRERLDVLRANHSRA